MADSDRHPLPGRAARRRSLARRFAMRALYQWQLNPASLEGIEMQFHLEEPDSAEDDTPLPGADGGREVVKVEPLTPAGGYWQPFRDADVAYFRALVSGVEEARDELEMAYARHLDRPVSELDPVERAILLLGSYELIKRPDVPARVAINEGVELAKVFGATNSHRFINGLLDRVARGCRGQDLPLRHP